MKNTRIKFRGKVLHNENNFFSGQWVYGSVIYKSTSTYIYYIDVDEYGNIIGEGEVEVDPTTVGQFTGKLDINNTELYENDIVEWTRYEWVDLSDIKNGYREKTDVSHIVFRDYGFWIDSESFGWEGEKLWDWNSLKIIGNIN